MAARANTPAVLRAGKNDPTGELRQPGPNDRWWRNRRHYLDRNEAFKHFAYWLVPGASRPKRPVGGWTPLEQQSFEFLFWLYELDARIRKYYLFAAPVSELGWNELGEIIRPAHPMKGCLPRWTDLTANDPGAPLGLESDSAAYPIYGGNDARHGFTPWKYLKDDRTGVISKHPVTFNLNRSNRSIYEEFKLRSEEIGFRPPSRRRIFALVTSLRSEFKIPAPSPTAHIGERRVPIAWDSIEDLERSSPKTKPTSRTSRRIYEARRTYEKCMAAIRVWEEYAAAIAKPKALVH